MLLLWLLIQTALSHNLLITQHYDKIIHIHLLNLTLHDPFMKNGDPSAIQVS